MSSDLQQGFRLGRWKIEPLRGAVTGPNDEAIHLEPKVMDVFVCLAENANQLVTRDQLLKAVWHQQDVTDEPLTRAIGQLRRALHDDRDDPQYIETVPKKGYRLICPVTSVAEDTDAPENAMHSSSESRHRRQYLAIAAGITSIALAIILATNQQVRDQMLRTNEQPQEMSVAVLPFIDMSQDGSQQYLGDGVAEELIHVLSNLPDLRVTARTSSFAFRDSQEDIRKIGSKLGVATILEGSVRKDGDRIRVTSQLVDTRDGYHLWSQIYDRDTSDLLSIQREIATKVARTFELRDLGALGSNDRVARAVEMQAYDFYLLGMHYLRKETVSSNLLAVEYFARAIEADPSFARAYAGLSDSYGNRYWYERDRAFLDKAESAVAHALQLDDRSAHAFFSLGDVRRLNNDQPGSIAAYEKAIELNPNNARAYARLANRYYAEGQDDLAYSMVQKAFELNPMSAQINTTMGSYEYEQSNYDWDSAYPFFKRAMEIDPEYPGSYSNIGHYYWSNGQLDQAVPYFRKAVDLTTGPTRVGGVVESLMFAYIDLGDFKTAAETIDRMKEIESDNSTVINAHIQLQLARGEFSAARNSVHSVLATWIDDDLSMGLLAFYEMVLGDVLHAEEIYSRLAAAPKPAQIDVNRTGDQTLFWERTLTWGMLGAVNLAHLHTNNGYTASAKELLHKARAYLQLRNPLSSVNGSQYVSAQIAAVERNNDVAIDYFRKAVDAGWSKAWFARIDPIMIDLRKDERFMQILEELEDKLLKMRERSKMLAAD